jgi:hypothetical protein
MKYIWIGVPLSLAIHAAAGAQAPSPAKQGAAMPASVETITVTGCLASAAPGSSGSLPVRDSSTAPSGGHFVLTKVASPTQSDPAVPAAPARGTSNPAAVPSGPVGTSGVAVPVSQYILYGRPDELAKHLGQRLEVTGTVTQMAPDAAGTEKPKVEVIPHEPQRGPVDTSQPAGAEATAPQEKTAHPSVQHLSVQSVKTVAGSCQ